MIEVKSMREIRQIECSQCKNKYYDDQDTCPFCGHTTRKVHVESNDSDDFFRDEPKPTQNTSTKSSLTDQDIIILVVLAIFFWPAALIFLFVKLKK
jgi:predicted amidophosphoribosyltransferase